MVKVECIAEFLDKIKIEVKFITIRGCIIIEELKKIIQSSEKMIILVRIEKSRIEIDMMVFYKKSDHHSR